MRILKNAVAAIVSVALTVTLSPMSALAQSTASAGVGLSKATVSAQAPKTKTVYVVSGIDSNIGTSSFAYDGDGLLKKQTYNRPGSTVTGVKKTARWSYDGKKRLRTVKEVSSYIDRGHTAVCKYTTNSKGVITKESYSEKGAWGLSAGRAGSKATVKYILRSGRIVGNEQTAQTGSSPRIGSKTLAYKNGKVSSYTFAANNTKVPLAYDKHGNLKRDGRSDWQAATGTFENSYSPSGLLMSTVMRYKGIESSVMYNYTYKPIEVEKSNLAKVNAQQWAIKNGNLNFALGGYMLPGVSIGMDNMNLISSLNM